MQHPPFFTCRMPWTRRVSPTPPSRIPMPQQRHGRQLKHQFAAQALHACALTGRGSQCIAAETRRTAGTLHLARSWPRSVPGRIRSAPYELDSTTAACCRVSCRSQPCPCPWRGAKAGQITAKYKNHHQTPPMQRPTVLAALSAPESMMCRDLLDTYLNSGDAAVLEATLQRLTAREQEVHRELQLAQRLQGNFAGIFPGLPSESCVSCS